MQPTRAQIATRNRKEQERKKKEQERKAAEAKRPRPGAGSPARQAELNKYKKAAAKPAPKPAAKPAPKPAAKPKPTVADYQDAQGNTYDGNTGRLKAAAQTRPAASADAQPVLRSPAASAPIHASPAAFGSAPRLQQQAASPYVGSSAATPPRPSTPAQAVQQQAPNPFQGIGDIRNQPLPQAPVQQDAELSAGTQQYGGQQLQGINQNGIDMERRRAFLDADNSLAGLKAVKDLLNRRKLSISVES
jgi:hypothetical protein